MVAEIAWVVGTTAILAAFVAGRVGGYAQGVRDTEQRWANAVAKADDARRKEP